MWRPASEAEATSNIAAFIEWLEATQGGAPGGPAEVRAWAGAASGAFAAALRGFLGLAPGAGWRAALGQALDRGARLMLGGARGWREVGAGELQAGPLPVALATVLRADDDALAADAACHVLWRDHRPDQRLLWPRPLTGPWPLAALFAGATLLVCETPPVDPQGLAAAEGAMLLRRPA